MLNVIITGGPYALVLALLAVLIVALSVKKAVDIFVRTGLGTDRLSGGLNAILFWGCLSAVLGFLGQFSGMYKSLMVIRSAGLVHPGLVAEGLAVSLITTLLGLGLLAFSGMVWFGLRCRLRSLDRT